MEIIIVIVACLCLVAAYLFLHSRRSKGNDVSEEGQPIPSQQKTQDISQGLGNPELTESDPCSAEPEKDEEKLKIQNKQLVLSLHKVLEEDKVFLRPDIHIDDVAKMLLTNRTYVTRMMRQEYGLSFIEYVNVARIQYSQKLLYSSDMTLDEIAEKSGFQSTSNYCRAFKRYIGTSPMGWLQSMK